jgi:hypothetical protein
MEEGKANALWHYPKACHIALPQEDAYNYLGSFNMCV